MKIVLSTHGKLGEGVVDSLRMLIGEPENLDVITFSEVMGIDELREEVSEYLENNSGELLIFTDIIGGTPFNVISTLTRDRENVKIFYGLNLPVIIEAVSMSELMDLQELYQHLLEIMPDTIGFSEL